MGRPLKPWLRPLPVLFLLLILAGCGSRDRSNPFDPKNPDTGGVLPGLRVVAGDHRADISWDLQAFGSGPKVRIERFYNTESEFRTVAVLPLEAGAYSDDPLTNGGEYIYRVRVVAASGSEGVATVDTAGPEADRPWILDSGNERLVELSPDNRDIRHASNSPSTPADVQFDAHHQVLWVANPFDGTVAKLDPSGQGLAAYSVLDFPNVLAVDESRGELWVGDDRNGTVMKITSGGERICRAEGFAGVASLAVDPEDGGVWVAEPDAGRVTKVRADGIRQVTVRGFTSPRRVVFDPGSAPLHVPAAVWIADFANGQIAKATPQGREIFRLVGYPGISALHLESTYTSGTPYVGGTLYVGVTSLVGDGMILALDQDGRELWRASGPRNPVGIALNRESGGHPDDIRDPCRYSVWVADAGSGAAWKFTCGGRFASRQGGFSAPQAIACVIPGPPYPAAPSPRRPPRP